MQGRGRSGRAGGSLVGLAMVVGLIAFFIADSLPAAPSGGGSEPPPTSVDSPPTALAILAWVLGVVIASLLILATVLLCRRLFGVLAAARAFRRLERLPSTDHQPGGVFLQAAYRLLAAFEGLPEGQLRALEAELLRFLGPDSDERTRAHVNLLASRQVSAEVSRFLAVAKSATEQQRDFIAMILTRRGTLR